MKRALLVLFALLGVTLIACGGGDDNGDGGDSNDDSPATAVPTTADTDGNNGGDDADADQEDSDGDDDSGIDFGDGTASVTIDGARYDFDMAGDFTVCRDVFGIIQLAGPSADGQEIGVNGLLPPVDWATYTDGRYDPPQLEVDDEVQDILWIASESYAAERGIEGSSQIDSYTLEGLTASGTATFVNRRAIDRGDPPDPVAGTFEVSCSE